MKLILTIVVIALALATIGAVSPPPGPPLGCGPQYRQPMGGYFPPGIVHWMGGSRWPSDCGVRALIQRPDGTTFYIGNFEPNSAVARYYARAENGWDIGAGSPFSKVLALHGAQILRVIKFGWYIP